MIKPIALNDAKVPDGTEVVVSGWGLTKVGFFKHPVCHIVVSYLSVFQEGVHEKPPVLRAVKVNMVPYSDCQKDYKGLLTDSMICANAKGKDACQVT